MELKPLNDTGTIKIISSSKENIKLLDKKEVVDPNREIPSGIYKVIKWEKMKLLWISIISGAINFGLTILLIVFATATKPSWLSYSVPIIVWVASFYKMFVTIFELSSMKKAIIKYREDLKFELNSIPPFISKMYISFYKKQVSHNWLTFSIIFYLGIFTLLLWWLKDFSWWIFKMDLLIAKVFKDPDKMVVILSAILIVVAVVHILFTILRKKRIMDINAFFGGQIASHSDLETIKSLRNKFYRRIFLASVMTILIIPLFIRFVLKRFKLDKRKI